MENDNLPYLSVIITAYNRKEFLLNAIKSAVNQTLEKKNYEIIVIKNFQDDMIDNYIVKNNIKGIISNDNSLGGKLIEALNVATGDIISFLEDDDLFFENKLDIVYNEFKKDNNVVYYHNLSVPINRNGKAININSVNISIDSNMSSISIRKSIVKFNRANIINILMAPDILMYLYALESNKKIIKGKEKLTHHMFHNSASNIVSSNFEEYRKFVFTSSDLVLNNFVFFKSLVHSKKSINYLNSRITHVQIQKYIFGANEVPSKLINYVINSSGSRLGSLKYRVAFFLSCILIKVYPRSRKYISNNVWNIHSKRANEII
ncbi:Glycosyl transferase family 2 [Thermoplasmatales archaeon]|nr:Glycosyl transferase family 2 [Thermoplasmatales archaeon]